MSKNLTRKHELLLEDRNSHRRNHQNHESDRRSNRVPRRLANKMTEYMTYKKIQEYVKSNYGFVPKTCWIAHAKELYGLTVRKAWNRKGKQRKHQCPEEKLAIIKDALNHFGLLNKAAGQ